MAEAETKKKTAAKSGAKKGSAGGSKSGRAGSVKEATSASRAPAKAGGKKKKSAKSVKKKKTDKAREKARAEAKERRKNEFAQQFVPYILAVVVVFLALCFVLNAVGGAEAPDEHMMGFVGYYICWVFFGAFSWAAYLIPVFLVLLIVFWKRNYEDGVIALKSVLSVVTMLLVAAVAHVVACSLDDGLVTLQVSDLFTAGTEFSGGGALGGLLGFLLYNGLRLPGTIVVAVLTLPLLILYLVGLSPAVVLGKLTAAIRGRMERASEERALRRAEEDEDYDEDDDSEDSDEDENEDEDDDTSEDEEDEDDEDARKMATAAKYRERRAKVNAKAEAEASAKADEKTSGKSKRKNTDDTDSADDASEDAGENIVVNPRTGEVLGSEKSRRGRGEAISEEDEFAPLPFYDTPDTRDEDEEDDGDRDVDDAPVYTQRTAASTMPTAAVSADDEDWDGDGDMDDIDTMEVGYEDRPSDRPTDRPSEDSDDDDPDRGDLVPVKRKTASTRTKPDPYASVRILESDPTAVDESGLDEEEIVISSAHTPADGEALEGTDPTENGEAAETAEAEEAAPPREYVFPPVDLLTKGSSRYEANEEEIAENTQALREVLESFRIGVKEISCSCGPTITRFEVKPDSGVRVRSIANLVDDIAMGLAKAGVRIEAPIPGKAAVGIEVPNADPATVYFRNILETPEFRNHKSRIAACLGADVTGRPVILDINKMPHLLVAGTTGSGKSVCINSIIMSILYKAKPDEVKLILIDPKKVEFAVYRDLPHLYCPIISDPKKAAGALNSAVNEMERRFELIEEVGVRNLAGYNEVTADDPARPPLPQMVIIIDELADLMMTASNEVETAICRLAQKARAAGMHLILGTQRPSTDVITGLIKANVPSRIAFTVTQSIDSRIIIDTVGAEKLIGRGDMLYSPVGTTKPQRVQGTFVSDGEVERVVTFLRENNERGEFDESFTRQIEIEAAKCASGKKKGGSDPVDIDDSSWGSGASSYGGGAGAGGSAPSARKDNEDPKFWEALEVAAGKDKIGTSALQRALNLGYGRAAKIIDRMEELGLVGPDPGTKQGRKVLFTKQDYLEYRANGLPSGGSTASSDGDGAAGDFDDL